MQQQQQQSSVQQSADHPPHHRFGAEPGREDAGYEPDYYDDAADLRNWLEHRDRQHGRTESKTLRSSSYSLRPSIDFRPYVDEADDVQQQQQQQQRRRVNPKRLPLRTVQQRQEKTQQQQRQEKTQQQQQQQLQKQPAPRGRGLGDDELARAYRRRSELCRSFGRKRGELDRVFRLVWRADRTARLRRRVSDVKNAVLADLARRRNGCVRADDAP